jgi:hypothetical protein
MGRGVLDTPLSRSMTAVGETADVDYIGYFPANFFIAALIDVAASS